MIGEKETEKDGGDKDDDDENDDDKNDDDEDDSDYEEMMRITSMMIRGISWMMVMITTR